MNRKQSYTLAPRVGTTVNLYIATTGNDVTGDGSQGNPWATFGKAKAYIRGINAFMGGDINVWAASGTYRETLAFTPADSASNSWRIRYRSSGTAGSAHLSGGTLVTGWSVYSGSISRANVGTGLSIETLWENGTRARKCRTPKYVADGSFPMQRGPYKTTVGTDLSSTEITYGVGDLDPTGWSTTDLQVQIWSGGNSFGSGSQVDWFTDTTPVSAVNSGTRKLTLAHTTKFAVYGGGIGSRYYVQGTLPLLTEAGEFYYDSAAGFLYYWPVTGAIGSQEITRPTATDTVTFTGTNASTPVSGISLDGLTIEYSDYIPWYRSGCDVSNCTGEGHAYPLYDQAMTPANARHGLVMMQDTDGIEIVRCKLTNAGMSGIYGHGRNTNYRVDSTLINHCGFNGIYIDGQYPSEGNNSRLGEIVNFKIHDVGELVGHAGGITLRNSGDCWVHFGEIYNAPRWGLFIGCQTDVAKADVYALGLRAEYLSIHDVCMDSGDVGAVYLYGISKTTPYLSCSFSQIKIQNISAAASVLDIVPDAVFTDNQTYGMVFANVQVTGTIAGSRLRIAADSGAHTATNCSFNADGTNNAGFNSALMQTEYIGTRSWFPY